MVVFGRNCDSFCVSFSVPLPVAVALRRGPFAVSPQKTVQLKITSASVTMNSDPQNSKNATSKPARRALVGDWLLRWGRAAVVEFLLSLFSEGARKLSTS